MLRTLALPSISIASLYSYCALTPCTDYAWSLYGMEGSQREAVLHSCHQRGANRLLDLCFSNGGIYSECRCVCVLGGRVQDAQEAL